MLSVCVLSVWHISKSADSRYSNLTESANSKDQAISVVGLVWSGPVAWPSQHTHVHTLTTATTTTATATPKTAATSTTTTTIQYQS